MKDFNDFASPTVRGQIVTQVLIKRGGFRLYGPNNAEMEREVSAEVDVVMEVLRRYHKWLSS